MIYPVSGGGELGDYYIDAPVLTRNTIDDMSLETAAPYGQGAVVTHVSAPDCEGLDALLSSQRSSQWSGAAWSMPAAKLEKLTEANIWTLRMKLRTLSGALDMTYNLEFWYNDGTPNKYLNASVTANDTGWATLTGTWQLSTDYLNEALDHVVLYPASGEGQLGDYYLDAVSLDRTVPDDMTLAGVEPHAQGGSIVRETGLTYTGSDSIKASSRANLWEGAAWSIPAANLDSLVEKSAWTISMRARTASGTMNLLYNLEFWYNDGSGNKYLSLSAPINDTDWTLLSNSWFLGSDYLNEALDHVVVYPFSGEGELGDYYIDDVCLVRNVLDDNTLAGAEPYGQNCNIAMSVAQVYKGSNSMLASGRTAEWNGVAWNIPAANLNVSDCMQWTLSIYARAAAGAMDLTYNVEFWYTDSSSKTLSAYAAIKDSEWTEIRGTWSLGTDYLSNLDHVVVYPVTGSGQLGDYYVDNTLLTTCAHTAVSVAPVAATCTASGLTEGSSCSVCGKVLTAQQVIPALGHTWNDGAVTKPATEQESGVMTYTCTVCGETYTEDIPVLPHTHNYTAVVTAPTCTAAGFTTYTCTCGDSYTAGEVAKLGHTAVTDAAVAATCTASGLTEGSHCSVCDAVLVAQEEVAALGHDYRYTDNGADHTVTCSRCDYSVTEAHTYTDGVCVCGATQTTEPTLDTSLNFIGNTFALGSALEMVYQFSQPNANAYADAYVVIEKDVYGEDAAVRTIQKADFAKLGTVRYRVSFTDIAAKEMGDNFRATVYGVDANGKLFCGETLEISIAANIMDILNNPNTDAKLRSRQTCVDLLNYGSAAQTAFAYNTENLVNELMSAEQKALGTQSAPAATNYQAVTGTGACTFLRVSPTLGSKVTMVAMFNISALIDTYESLDVVVTNAATGAELGRSKLERATPTSTIGKVYFDDISAGKMRTLINIGIYDGETLVSPTLSWSIESYVATVLASATQTAEMKAVCNAKLNYGDSAAVYLAG